MRDPVSKREEPVVVTHGASIALIFFLQRGAIAKIPNE
jgi:hypothetical protein